VKLVKTEIQRKFDLSVFVVTMKILASDAVSSGRCLRFGRTYCLHLQGRKYAVQITNKKYTASCITTKKILSFK
jgi:hypothetical protein